MDVKVLLDGDDAAGLTAVLPRSLQSDRVRDTAVNSHQNMAVTLNSLSTLDVLIVDTVRTNDGAMVVCEDKFYQLFTCLFTDTMSERQWDRLCTNTIIRITTFRVVNILSANQTNPIQTRLVVSEFDVKNSRKVEQSDNLNGVHIFCLSKGTLNKTLATGECYFNIASVSRDRERRDLFEDGGARIPCCRRAAMGNDSRSRLVAVFQDYR